MHMPHALVSQIYGCSAQGLDDERERALKGLNTTLAWLQECIVLSGMHLYMHLLATIISCVKILMNKCTISLQDPAKAMLSH